MGNLHTEGLMKGGLSEGGSFEGFLQEVSAQPERLKRTGEDVMAGAGTARQGPPAPEHASLRALLPLLGVGEEPKTRQFYYVFSSLG